MHKRGMEEAHSISQSYEANSKYSYKAVIILL